MSYEDISYLFHERALDMRCWIVNEARSAEFALAISYPTSARGIIVSLTTPPKYGNLK